ncbi:uncharacterized protein [Lolium perenne]|uniref:uncharacterized protein n=1 Tax=Lolium perenne TaxID=4522 RepID=UPI0021F63DC2|nr:uncharacterized protein LOC127316392 [Lolium perenne]
MRIHMRGLRLWGVLTGEVPCPPRPIAPVPPTPPPVPQALAEDATQADRDAAKSAEAAADEAYEEQVLAYSEALGSYRDSLATFTQWCDEDARAAAVLSQSVQPQFASEFMGLATIAEMWSHLRQRYQPSGDSLYLSVLRQEHDLQQGDSTVDEFYTQSAAIWRQLDSLRSVVCGTCQCCRTVRSDMDFQRIHEFLSRLRPEFEPRRAQLFAGGRVPISEVLTELRAEETRLRGAGLLGTPSVLAARVPTAPAPPLLPTPVSAASGGARSSRGGGRSRPPRFCTHCRRSGHLESDCYQKQRGVPPRAPPSAPVTTGFTEQDIVRLQRLLASSGSASTGTAASAAVSSPPSGHSHSGPGWGWPTVP